MNNRRSLANVRPWVLLCLIGAGFVTLAVMVLVGAHRVLTGVPVADPLSNQLLPEDLRKPTSLAGSDYYVSASRRGFCTLTVPGQAPREIIVGRTTLVSGTGARLPGPHPDGTTLSCNNGADLTQGPITRLYWLPENGLVVTLLGAVPFAIGQTGFQLRRRRRNQGLDSRK